MKEAESDTFFRNFYRKKPQCGRFFEGPSSEPAKWIVFLNSLGRERYHVALSAGPSALFFQPVPPSPVTEGLAMRTRGHADYTGQVLVVLQPVFSIFKDCSEPPPSAFWHLVPGGEGKANKLIATSDNPRVALEH